MIREIKDFLTVSGVMPKAVFFIKLCCLKGQCLRSQKGLVINFIDFTPQFIERAVTVDRFFHIAAQTVPHKHVFGEVVHRIFITKPRKSVAAVMGCTDSTDSIIDLV